MGHVSVTPRSALICERWQMPLGELGTQRAAWFLDWVLRKPAESSKHITACYTALHSLRDMQFNRVLECFGGLGCQALITETFFAPQQHLVADAHPQAAQHLRAVLPAGVQVVCGDAYKLSSYAADLIVLDCGDFTIHAACTRLRSWLDKIFAARPAAVVLTDIAGPRMQLHKQRYSSLLGSSAETYQDYLHGLDGWFRRVYGYGVRDCWQHRWSAVMTLLPARDIPGRVHTTPARPVGIVLEGSNDLHPSRTASRSVAETGRSAQTAVRG